MLLAKESCIYDEPFCPQHVCDSLSFVVVFAILSLVRLREECFFYFIFLMIKFFYLFNFEKWREFNFRFFFFFWLMKEMANII